MQIYYETNQRKVVVASGYGHGVLYFDCAGGYHSPVFKVLDNKQGSTECPFQYLNMFLQSRSVDTQNALWNFYSEMHTIFNTSLNSEIDYRLTVSTQKLSQIPGVTPAEVIQWAAENIHVPNVIMDTYQADLEGIYTRGKTYIKSEYIEYAALILYSKMLVPIMGEYFRKLNMRYKTSADGFFTAYSSDQATVKTHVEMLMMDTLAPLINTLPGIERIVEFINMSASTGQINDAEIIIDKQLSMDDINYYILAVLFTRKMVSAAFYGLPGNNLASRLATSIKSILGAVGRNKITLNNDGISKESSEDVKGVYDDTHAQYTLSVGHIAILQYCATDEYLAPILGKYIDIEQHRRLSAALNSHYIYITQVHISIIALTLGNVMSPTILTHCDVPTVVNLLSYCYLILKDRHPEVANLAIHFPYLQDDRSPTPDDVRIKITSAHTSMLEKYFPLKTRKGTLTIVAYFNEMIIPNLQYVLVSPITGDTMQLLPDTLTKYVAFTCDAPSIIDPESKFH